MNRTAPFRLLAPLRCALAAPAGAATYHIDPARGAPDADRAAFRGLAEEIIAAYGPRCPVSDAPRFPPGGKRRR